MKELHCNCSDTFAPHELTFTLAECRTMWVEHFRKPANDKTPFVEMMHDVASILGWHHISTDINNLRKLDTDAQKKRHRDAIRMKENAETTFAGIPIVYTRNC